jgi:hypothetical protein
MAKLVFNVIPGFFNRFRSRWARAEIDQSLDMRKSFLTGDFFPDFCLRCGRAICTDDRCADSYE